MQLGGAAFDEFGRGALAGLQTDVQQLARGLESLSHELGRIFQYMEQQGNGSKEERK